MKYLDGSDVLIGDYVDLGGRMTGIVVADFDHALYAIDFQKERWTSLQKGIIVESPEAGLIHFSEPTVDLVLLQRSSRST